MNNVTRNVAAFLSLSLSLALPASAAETLGFSISQQSSQSGEMTITVLDEAKTQPVAGATVALAGAEQTTDASGVLTFGNLPTGFKSVTVRKPGYAAVTVAGVDHANVTFFLKPVAKTSATQPIVSGRSSNWEPIKNSSLVYAGIAIRNLSVYDLPSFEPDSLISPIYDHIDVMGDRAVPSNLAVPKQTVRVSIFTIHLDKQLYRLPVASGKEMSLSVLHGNIPAKELMGVAQGSGDYLDVVNLLKMSRMGMGSKFTPVADTTQNVAASVLLAPKYQVTPQQPPFTARVFAAAVTDTAGDRTVLVPTDLKMAAKSGEKVQTVSLAAPTTAFGKMQNVVTLAQEEQGGRISGIISANASKTVQPGAFLDVAPVPTLNSIPESVTVTATAKNLGALVFNAVPAKAKAGTPSTPVWYVYSLPGSGSQTLPAATLAGLNVTDYANLQFEFDAKKVDSQNFDGQDAMLSLTRFTRASAEVKLKAGLDGGEPRDFGLFPNRLFRSLTGMFAF